MTNLRVLLLSHQLSLTGAPKVIIDAFEAMQPNVDVFTISMEAGPLTERCCHLGPLITLQAFQNVSGMTKRLQRRMSKIQTERTIRRWRPDLIYVNTVAALPILKKLTLPSVPIVLHVHELKTSIRIYTNGLEDVFLRRPSCYIAVSEAVRQDLISEFSIAEEKIHLIYEFVPDSLLQTVPEKSDRVSGRRPFVVGGAGLPQTRKGTARWLDMAAELITLVGAENVRFVWVGVRETIEDQMFRLMAEKMGIASNIEFVKVTPEPLRYFADFDVFAMTSWEDPCPIVVLESMALQIPVVCFAGSGGAPEEIGDTGIAVPGFSARGMAEAIRDILTAPERRATLGQQARERVLSEFTASVQAPKIQQVIHHVVSRSLETGQK